MLLAAWRCCRICRARLALAALAAAPSALAGLSLITTQLARSPPHRPSKQHHQWHPSPILPPLLSASTHAVSSWSSWPLASSVRQLGTGSPCKLAVTLKSGRRPQSRAVLPCRCHGLAPGTIDHRRLLSGSTTAGTAPSHLSGGGLLPQQVSCFTRIVVQVGALSASV
jgi:hypothetical protein